MGKLREDWPLQLDKYLFLCSERRFEWGVFDCLIFVSDWVHIACGFDPMEKARGRYNDEQSSKAVACEVIGTRDYINGLDSLFNRVLPVYCRRGDIISYNHNENECLGIVVDGGAMVLTLSGLLRVPLRKCSNGWSIR